MYIIQVKDAKGCIVSKQVEGEYIDIIIPNFFTPNGNGDKDFWYPENVEEPVIETASASPVFVFNFPLY